MFYFQFIRFYNILGNYFSLLVPVAEKNFAEKAGFEPTMPFWGILTFQASTFSHSVISPIIKSRKYHTPRKLQTFSEKYSQHHLFPRHLKYTLLRLKISEMYKFFFIPWNFNYYFLIIFFCLMSVFSFLDAIFDSKNSSLNQNSYPFCSSYKSSPCHWFAAPRSHSHHTPQLQNDTAAFNLKPTHRTMSPHSRLSDLQPVQD